MKQLLLFIWQLPQNLLGLIVLAVNYKSIIKSNGCYFVKHLADSGISLGNYIILDTDCYNSINDIKHEKGHQKQSKLLGWLYLPTIGLLSFTGNIYARLKNKNETWYYKQPWEAWADKLGGVQR